MIAGLSLRARGATATMNVARGYFHWTVEEK